jgi:hypothetical protein
MKTKDQFLLENLYQKILLLEFSKPINLTPEIFQNKIKDIYDLEKKSFDAGTQDEDDLIDDSMQPNFLGYCLMDNDELKAFIYGFDARDQIPIVNDSLNDYLDEITFYGGHDKEKLKQIVGLMNNNNTFYVSNFAAFDEYKGSIALGRMVFSFLSELKNKGFKYLLFDGRKDTMNLIFKGESLNQKRISNAGLNMVATTSPDQYDSSMLTLMEFI